MYELNLQYESEKARRHVEPVYAAIHNKEDPSHLTALIKAVPRRDLNIHWRGETLLCKALQENNVAAVETLLTCGADITTLSQVFDHDDQILRTETPLITAARTGCVDGVNLLVDAKAKLDLKDFTTGKSALHWACTHPVGRLAAQCLAERGADTNSRDHYLETAMAKVVRNKDLELAECLLRNGVYLNNPVNYSGDTALLYSLLSGALDIAELLVCAGSDVAVKDTNNNQDSLLITITMSVAESHEVYSMCKLLLAAGARPNQKHIEAVEENGTDQLVSMMWRYSMVPVSLKEQCRLSIRRVMLEKTCGRTILPPLEKLPVPKVIQEYLGFDCDE